MRYSIRLSYDGADFCGWQIQPNAPSVQESLETALSKLLRQDIKVTGAGRTDTKVSAINYVAHFDIPNDPGIDATNICYKLNAILPLSIRVHEVAEAADDFHARFGATERGYRYFINRRKDPFVTRMSYFYSFPLDVEAMNKAAEAILGTHDFRCFEKVGSDNKTSVCTVTCAHWDTWTPSHVKELGYPAEDGDYLVFTIKADRFLRNMVRAVVGSLLEVGRGKKNPEWIEGLISGGTRSDAGESVPGHALFLNQVKY
ncbi:MAG: tRNA pseudouridine(38-40) synthase TruA [Bacteroidales bacterium]|nr:tRNA pseudouridine(38-40) synthase TruA [Bacteroidales bacterium]